MNPHFMTEAKRPGTAGAREWTRWLSPSRGAGGWPEIPESPHQPRSPATTPRKPTFSWLQTSLPAPALPRTPSNQTSPITSLSPQQPLLCHHAPQSSSAHPNPPASGDHLCSPTHQNNFPHEAFCFFLISPRSLPSPRGNEHVNFFLFFFKLILLDFIFNYKP